MFEITDLDAVLEHLNCRVEMKGEEREPAVDLKFSLSLSNDVLDAIEPGLKAAFYAAAPGAVDDMLTPGHRPTRRFHVLEEVPVNTQLIGAKVTIKRGFTGQSDIHFGACDVNKLRVSILEGGTCNLTLRVQCAPDSEQMADLYELQRETVVLTVTPPTAEEQLAATRERQKSKAPPPDDQPEFEVLDQAGQPIQAPESGWPFGTTEEKPDTSVGDGIRNSGAPRCPPPGTE